MKHSASQAHQIEKEVDIIEERREMIKRKFEGEGTSLNVSMRQGKYQHTYIGAAHRVGSIMFITRFGVTCS